MKLLCPNCEIEVERGKPCLVCGSKIARTETLLEARVSALEDRLERATESLEKESRKRWNKANVATGWSFGFIAKALRGDK